MSFVLHTDTPTRRHAVRFMPLLTSVLYVLAFPKFSCSAFAWVALVPLLSTILTDGSLSSRHAFFSGWGTGTLAYAGLLYWLIPTYQAAHQPLVLALGCLILLAGYLGLYWGVWTLLLLKARGTTPILFCLYAASSWTALEYARTWLLSGFPWALLADSQVAHLSLIQIASITGSYGVSFLIVLMNSAIARRGKSLPLALGVVIMTIILGIPGVSVPNDTAPLQVALLQGNVDQYKKWDKAYVQEIQDRYAGLVREAVKSPVELIIWPETSIPGYLLQDVSLREWLVGLVRKSRTNHLVGAPNEVGEKIYNGSFSLSPEGVLKGEYEKKHLVPFGEVVPAAHFLGWYISALNALGGFAAGTASPVVQAAGIPLGINICYESIFPSLVRDSVRQGAQILVNQTNDGWYMRTAAPYQHWAPNVYRAVENRRYLLRANNTGISGIIDPWGRTVRRSPIFEAQVVTGTVYPRTDLSFYTRHGDVFAIVCLLFCLVVLAPGIGRVILRQQ